MGHIKFLSAKMRCKMGYTFVVVTLVAMTWGHGVNGTKINAENTMDIRELLNVWRPSLELPWGDINGLKPACGEAMLNFSQALRDRQHWASIMLDASGTATPGFADRSDFWLGSRFHCDQVGAYFLAAINVKLSPPIDISNNKIHPLNKTLPRHTLLGLCVPSECGSPEAVRLLLNTSLGAGEARRWREVEVFSVKQLPAKLQPWTQAQLLFVIMCVLVTLFVCVGTLLDVTKFWKHSQEPCGKLRGLRDVMVAFSLPRNLRHLFTKTSNADGLSVIHGLRFINMAWIIFGHTCRIALGAAGNPYFQRIVEADFIFQIVASGDYAVETFFFMTGLLLAYSLLGPGSERLQISSFVDGVIKLTWVLLYRIIRLLVPLVFAILLSTASLQFLEPQVQFPFVMPDHEVCPRYWWRTILHINNLFPYLESCAPWTWYLAADTQLYTLAAILLVLYIAGWQKTSLTLFTAFLLASWAITAAISFQLNYIPSVTLDPVIHSELLGSKPWTRLGTFWVGIVTGALITRKKSTITWGVGGWRCCWVLCCLTLFFVIHSDHFTPALGLAGATIFVTLRRFVWGLCHAFIVLACVHRKAGWIGAALEWPPLAILGRLSYCAYLIHIPMMEWIFVNMDGPFYISRGIMTPVVIGFIVLSYVAASVTSLLFEAPFIRLLKLALHPVRRNPQGQRVPGHELDVNQTEN